MNNRKYFSTTRGWSIALLAPALLLGAAANQPNGEWGADVAYANETPMVTVSPSVVSLRKGTKITIAGSGFQKGKELGIRVVMGGVVSDIRHQVKPEPNVNEHGVFYCEWVFDGEQNLLSQGATALTIVDEDGNVLAHTPVVLMKEAKKEAKKE